MTSKQIIEELKKLGSPSIKNIFLKHGAREPVYGVKVEDLKKVQKKATNDQKLAMELYDSGVMDAMYLAGLMADGSKMSKKDLQAWAEKASSYMISEYTVAWVTSENPDGWEIGLKWIDSPKETVASSGWSTLSSIVQIKPNEELDIPGIKALFKRIEKEIPKAQNRVRFTMNGFVIAAGGAIPELTDLAIATARKIGEVKVEMGGTACKVPFAPDYIEKMKQKGYVGKKRKTVKC
jgi:3-methyladenine DNA glycosylase AlkD